MFSGCGVCRGDRFSGKYCLAARLVLLPENGPDTDIGLIPFPMGAFSCIRIGRTPGHISIAWRDAWTTRKAFLSIPRNERHNAFPPYLIAERLAVRLLCPRNSLPKDRTRKSKWFGVSFSTLGSPRPKQNTAHLRFCRENRTVRMRRFRYYRVSLFRHMPETVAALGRRTARTYMNP